MGYVKFDNGADGVLEILYDKPPEAKFSERYNKNQYPYAVKIVDSQKGISIGGMGNSLSWYASENIHEKLQSVKAGQGFKVRIWKEQDGKVSKFHLYRIVNNEWVEITSQPPPVNGTPNQTPPVEGDRYYEPLPEDQAPPPEHYDESGKPENHSAVMQKKPYQPMLLTVRYVSALVAKAVEVNCPVEFYNTAETQTSIAIGIQQSRLSYEELLAERDQCLKALNAPEEIIEYIQLVNSWIEGTYQKKTPIAKEVDEPPQNQDQWRVNLEVGVPDSKRKKINPKAPIFTDSIPAPPSLCTAWGKAGYKTGQIDANGVLVFKPLPF